MPGQDDTPSSSNEQITYERYNRGTGTSLMVVDHGRYHNNYIFNRSKNSQGLMPSFFCYKYFIKILLTTICHLTQPVIWFDFLF